MRWHSCGGRNRAIAVGLTGTIASGKSTVALMLKRHGAIVINADEVGHELLCKGKYGWGRIVKNFGTGVLDANGNVDRGKLAKCVFVDEHSLKRLNILLHPIMVKRIESLINQFAHRGAKFIAIEAAVLFEMGLHKFVDEVWVTHADEQTILKRLTERGMSRDEALARMRSQISPSEFTMMADRVITCNRSLLHTAYDVSYMVTEALRCGR